MKNLHNNNLADVVGPLIEGKDKHLLVNIDELSEE